MGREHIEIAVDRVLDGVDVPVRLRQPVVQRQVKAGRGTVAIEGSHAVGRRVDLAHEDPLGELVDQPA
jgi:hypothetical protein